ncbi:MAG: Uncharacterized protein XE11_0038 [Methanomicrobiales archaeon 53_19]|jgi:hypothetical protein|uniref:hypothetical protein n=1 Tax=Methanocalculus sp. TaxID=2004547 RepID=UPI0007483C50|nr:hypothetical protein [Methanocalculus sp.]KUK70918.1 MAG: Uncharacterized protein XD88_0356 [Methanocalculus sp. 52_23]KUL05176.1 MAG: Uncharacterized protein XE11_0038 [Methanomicrobiales archaeon 53_19]HIJ05819.1 hypothetical protein [Methanocalculus sp.]
MSQRATDALFQSLFLLTDIRVMLREAAPLHQLSAEEKEKAAKLLKSVRRQVDILEEELI